MVGAGRDLCGSPSPTPHRSRVTYSRLHRTLSRWVLNISREGDSTTSLGSLVQGSVTLRVKKFFFLFRWNPTRACTTPDRNTQPQTGPHNPVRVRTAPDWHAQPQTGTQSPRTDAPHPAGAHTTPEHPPTVHLGAVRQDLPGGSCATRAAAPACGDL